jgi:1-deoxy-D-xylulose-5-phosphate reductoisomerase
VKRIFLLGSTGSIGRQTLDVVRWHPDEFQVVGLAANRPSPLFLEQVAEFQPDFACLTSADDDLTATPGGPEILRGGEHLAGLACESAVDLLVVASSGTVGFKPTLAALAAGTPVALANKETLIMAGHLVTRAAREGGAALLPIDSEHSAIWQCLAGETPYRERIKRLLLTASGGAFRDYPVAALAQVTPEQALKHPTWSMGPKITIDSATLMNKGLEVIEAHWLFDTPFDAIDVVVHHQSVIHSMVEFVDGSVKAQLGIPDMRLPIQYALAYPGRLSAPTSSLDLVAQGQLTFAPVDPEKWPCLDLAYQAGRAGGSSPTVLNAANEEAVARFLQGSLRFLEIRALIQDCLEAHPTISDPSLDEVLAADSWARDYAQSWTAAA